MIVTWAAECLLLAGCDGRLWADFQDTTPRIFYEKDGQPVETAYTLARLQRDVAKLYGDVEQIGAERLEFGRQWEIEFRTIGQDRLMIERVLFRSPRIMQKWRQRGHHYRHASAPFHEFQSQEFLRRLQENAGPIAW